jgi:hypothetical protein
VDVVDPIVSGFRCVTCRQVLRRKTTRQSKQTTFPLHINHLFLERPTLELSGNTEAEARACRLRALPSTHHSNGLEFFLPQTNLS